MEVFSGSREPQFMAVFMAFRRLDVVFWAFFAFLRSSRSERQFFERSSTHTCECSRAPAN